MEPDKSAWRPQPVSREERSNCFAGEVVHQDIVAKAQSYFSEGNTAAYAAAGIDPVIAVGSETHHSPLDARFTKPPPQPVAAMRLKAMGYRLNDSDGKKAYALRKQTSEPAFGIIKSVLCFRMRLLRALDRVAVVESSRPWR